MATKKDPREGGRIWNWYYRYVAGPATVENAIHGCTNEAQDAWREDLARRRRWSQEQRTRKQAAKGI